MSSHLIYHPRRVCETFSGMRVYFDKPQGNQDPYVWNDPFLHTYYHMTELSEPKPGDINFWVSGDVFPDFQHLFCDLVFVVAQKVVWPKANVLDRSDPIVDTNFGFDDHYRWVLQHRFKRRQRVTLKADSAKSFQPQDHSRRLLDIVPILVQLGVSLNDLRASLRKAFASKPMPLHGSIARDLYQFLFKNACLKLTGKQLQQVRQSHPELASPWELREPEPGSDAQRGEGPWALAPTKNCASPGTGAD